MRVYEIALGVVVAAALGVAFIAHGPAAYWALLP